MTTSAHPKQRERERRGSPTGDLFRQRTPDPPLEVDAGQSRPPRHMLPAGGSGVCRSRRGSNREVDGTGRRMGAFRYAGKRALAVLLIINFGGYATIGSNGILRWSGYTHQTNERTGELARLLGEQAKLTHHIELLNLEGADADFVDEMVREQLGFIRPDEVILLRH